MSSKPLSKSCRSVQSRKPRDGDNETTNEKAKKMKRGKKRVWLTERVKVHENALVALLDYITSNPLPPLHERKIAATKAAFWHVEEFECLLREAYDEEWELLRQQEDDEPSLLDRLREFQSIYSMIEFSGYENYKRLQYRCDMLYNLVNGTSEIDVDYDPSDCEMVEV